MEQKNAVQLLQEIAFQARCALWISDGAFYLKYLPEEPTPADTITISDIDADNGIEVELTATEDLVTKMKIKWRLSWTAVSDRPEDTNEQTIILRHNVAKYGLQEQDYDFYIYNQPDIVYKCGTFWMIRNSITWKRIKFKTFLNKLNLETFDAVTLDFASPYVANGPVLAVVEKASYSSADNLVDFQCLVPVAAGTMEKYKFYWPSALPTTDTWPTADRDRGQPGGRRWDRLRRDGQSAGGRHFDDPGRRRRFRRRPQRRVSRPERLGRPHAHGCRLHAADRREPGDLHRPFPRLAPLLGPADVSPAEPARHHADSARREPDHD